MDVTGITDAVHVAGSFVAFKPSKTSRKLRNDDICFQCGCGGELIECDDCPRVFHLECISDLDIVPEGAWRCPWHYCARCHHETETISAEGQYCAHCPTSYCNLCASSISDDNNLTLRDFAAQNPPVGAVFSDLRKCGFSLQHPGSLLYVCDQCRENTDNAVCKIYKRPDSNIDNKKLQFKLSNEMMHKKLLRSLPGSVSQQIHTIVSCTESCDGLGILSSSKADTVTVSNPDNLNSDATTTGHGVTSNAIDGGITHDGESVNLVVDTSRTVKETVTSQHSEHSDEATPNCISDPMKSAENLRAIQSPDQVSMAVNFVDLSDPENGSSGTNKNMMTYSAVRKFFDTSNSSTLCKMKSKGWAFLYSYPVLHASQAPNSPRAHKLVGSRCRRYFSGYGKSDGVLVAYLAGKRNEGLALLHCVHDDGDEEDLDEEEATTAAHDFKFDCRTKSESNKQRLVRKHQLEHEMQSLVRAQGESQAVKIVSTSTKASLLAEAYKRVPVECIGYLIAGEKRNGQNKEGQMADSHSPTTSPVGPVSAITPIVLKRFSNAREAARLIMRCISGDTISYERDTDTTTTDMDVMEAAAVIKKDVDMVVGEKGETAERLRISAWKKEIVRCCRGKRAYFLGLKWQFVFLRVSDSKCIAALSSVNCTTRNSEEDSKCTVDGVERDRTAVTAADNNCRAHGLGVGTGAGSGSGLIPGTGPGSNPIDSEEVDSIAASLQRRNRARALSADTLLVGCADEFSLLRTECSQSKEHIDSLRNADLSFVNLMGVVMEHLSDNDSDSSSDDDFNSADSGEENDNNENDCDSFLSPARANIISRRSPKRSRNRRQRATQKETGEERKFPSLGIDFQADVPSHPNFKNIITSSKEFTPPSAYESRVWSPLYNPKDVHSDGITKSVAASSPTVEVPVYTKQIATEVVTNIVERGNGTYSTVLVDVPCYWSPVVTDTSPADDTIKTVSSSSSSSSSFIPSITPSSVSFPSSSLSSHNSPTPSRVSSSPSVKRPQISPSKQESSDSIADKALYSAMFIQFVPGMIVTYIKGGVDVSTEQIDARVGKSNGVGGDILNASKSNEREKERGEESQYASRSSKRISQGVGAGVKSARFGCVVRAPFFLKQSSSPFPSVGACNLGGAIASACSASPPSRSSSVGGSASTSSSSLLSSSTSSAAAAISTPAIGIATAAASSSLVFNDRTAVATRQQEQRTPDISPQPMLSIHTGVGDEIVTVPCSACCRVIPDDKVLSFLHETMYSLPKTNAKVEGIVAEHLKHQWSESDIAAFLDSTHVASGNVRSLISYMHTHRATVRAEDVMYYYSRLRRDHIVDNNGDTSDTHSRSNDSNTQSYMSSSIRAKDKEREKEKDALSNPSNVQLTDYLKKALQKDRISICSVFRQADLLLGRVDDGQSIAVRRGVVTSRSSTVPKKNTCVSLASSNCGINGNSSRIEGAYINDDASTNAQHSSSSSSVTNNNSGTTGSSIQGANTQVEVYSRAPRKVEQISPLGEIIDDPIPVNMRQFMQRFLKKRGAQGEKRQKTS